MQGYSIPKILILALILTTFSFGPEAKAEKTNDVAVLIDRSLSLEPKNRDEALRLITGLLENNIPPNLVNKWRFIPDDKQINDPDTLAYRLKLQTDLAAATQNKAGEFQISSPNLLLGAIGDLDTVLKLQNSTWKTAPPSAIIDYGTNASPSDPETHYELGRAIISTKLTSEKEYLLFVVSDGIEDLLNWPVSDYLDPKKLHDKETLQYLNFLNSTKMGLLRRRNIARKRGQTVVRDSNGRTVPGYSSEQQAILREHREKYDEMLIGKFALNPDELSTFFSSHAKKVPVFVEVYRNSPRSNLVASFVNPASSTLQKPHTLALGNSTLSWKVDIKNDVLTSTKLLVEALDNNGEPVTEALNKEIDADSNSLDLLNALPDLNGRFQVTLTTKSKSLSSTAVTFVQYDKPKTPNPGIAYSDSKFQEARNADIAFDLSSLGPGFTSKKIAWTWLLDDKPTAQKPTSLEWKLEGWDLDRNLPFDEDNLTGIPVKRATSITVANLIEAPSDNYFPFYGETCRLTVKGIWEKGAPSEAVTFITFPNIDLQVLGRSDFKESATNPRVVKEKERIKLSNWMHPENDKNTRYTLELEKWQDDKWVDYDSEEEPLEIIHEKNGVQVVVAKPFEEKIRYTVQFKYFGSNSQSDDEWDQPEGILLAETVGFVEFESLDWLPIIISIFAILALTLFFWNLKTRRS